jgi:hypothetical protein
MPTLSTAALVLLLLTIPVGDAMAAVPAIPKNRNELTGGAWFPYVISKVAPLESWTFAASLADVKRKNYSSDSDYRSDRRNTWQFPRFCFHMFRPRVKDWAALREAIDQYEGSVVWVMFGDCITAMASKPTFIAPILSDEGMKKLEDAIRNPPKADSEFVKKAMADIPSFCGYLEKTLGLEEKIPVDFDPQWLTRKGLAQSRGEFEEFVEPGDWPVFLARDPNVYAKTGKQTSQADRTLSIGIGMSEQGVLFKELGARWGSGRERQPILPDYRLLSRLDDITSSAIYAPDEISSLLAEYSRAEQVVREPQSIRGLDKLIRIAKWAQQLQLGIYFAGQ